MQPLLTTFIFLLLLSTITCSHLKRFVDSRFSDVLYKNYIEAETQADFYRAKALLNDLKAQTPPDDLVKEKPKKASRPAIKKKIAKRSKKLNFDLSRPPDNARLNLYPLIHGQEKKDELPIYEITATLIRNLYGKAPLFQEIPRAEYRLLDALIEQKEKTQNFLYPDDLSTLSLQDEHLQKLFSFILKGACKEEVHFYPSFLQFISYVPSIKNKINLFFTSQEILEAVFNDHVAKSLIAEQQRLWAIIFEQERMRKEQKENTSIRFWGRKECNDAMKLALQKILEQNGFEYPEYKDYFDISLGKKGSILFVKDPLSGIVIREKLPKVARAKKNEQDTE